MNNTTIILHCLCTILTPIVWALAGYWWGRVWAQREHVREMKELHLVFEELASQLNGLVAEIEKRENSKEKNEMD